MALVNTKKPNLVGGVSQQSDSLRFENQCTEQINADPSVIRGLQKRAPLEHVAELTDPSSQMIDLVTGPYKTFTHTINRDTEEQYIVNVSQKQNNHGYSDGLYRPEITVTHVDGTAQYVYWDPDVYKEIDGAVTGLARDELLAYLAPIDRTEGLPDTSIPPGNDEPDIKFASIADVTLILNTKVSPRIDLNREHSYGPPGDNGIRPDIIPPNSNPSRELATVQIRQAAFNQSYEVTITSTLENENASARFGSVTFSYTTPSNLTTGQVTTTDGSTSTTVVNYDDEAEELSCAFIAKKLFPQSRSEAIEPDGSVHPNWAKLTDLAQRGLIFRRKGDTIFFEKSRDHVPVDGGTFELIVTGNTNDFYYPVMFYEGGADTFTVEVAGPTQESMVAYAMESDSFSGLSNLEANTRRVEITTSPSSEEDDYWVKFETKDRLTPSTAMGLFAINYVDFPSGASLQLKVGKGRWREVGEPGSTAGLYKNYGMPLVLIRQSDGYWLIKAANGTNPTEEIPLGEAGGQAGYTPTSDDYSKFEWKDRDAGNDETNPHPTFANDPENFLGTKINALTFHQNRLVFATDESVCMSESGDIWNFYRTTVTTLLDSDPIDVATTHSKISILREMISYEDRLVLISDQTQFVAYGDPVLTPSTVSISPITSFEASKSAQPVFQGGSVFFPFKRGESSGVREWYSNDASNFTFSSNDITAHIPQYIKGNITKLAASSQENIILCLTDADRDTIYCFNYFETGQGREQFAWSKYTFPGSIVHSVDFIAEKAYVLHSSKTGGAAATSVQYHANISSLDFQPNKTDAALGVQVKLDRRLSEAEVARTYYPGTDRTLIYFPYAFTLSDSFDIGTDPDDSVLPRNSYKVVSAVDGSSAPALEGFIGRGIYVKGNWASDSPDVSHRTFFVGEDYEMSYTFSKPLFKPESGGRTAAIQGRHQLRYGSLMFSNSGPFNVEVTQADGTKYEHQFSGKILGSPDTVLGTMTLSTGDFRFPIFSESDSVEIKITSNNPIGPRLESAEFEANYSTRNRRL